MLTFCQTAFNFDSWNLASRWLVMTVICSSHLMWLWCEFSVKTSLRQHFLRSHQIWQTRTSLWSEISFSTMSWCTRVFWVFFFFLYLLNFSFETSENDEEAAPGAGSMNCLALHRLGLFAVGEVGPDLFRNGAVSYLVLFASWFFVLLQGMLLELSLSLSMPWTIQPSHYCVKYTLFYHRHAPLYCVNVGV